MTTEDTNDRKKWHSTEKIGVIGVLNLSKGRAPEEALIRCQITNYFSTKI